MQALTTAPLSPQVRAPSSTSPYRYYSTCPRTRRLRSRRYARYTSRLARVAHHPPRIQVLTAAPPLLPLSPQVHFSSSPGLLASLDDFYIVHSASAQLAVIETTNDVYNPELFELVTPRSCLCWARAIAANTLATTAPSWATLFAKEASGVRIASDGM
jgi:hypothetical protein